MSARNNYSPLVLFCLCVFVTSNVFAAAPPRSLPVCSDTDLAGALAQARPGDVVVIANGTYLDWDIHLGCSGTAAQGILLRAQTLGQVILSGSSRLTISGDYVTVSGLCFKDGRTEEEVWRLSGAHGRITDCALMNYQDGGHKWIRLQYGKQNRLDHNAILGKTERDVTLQIDIADSADLNHHRIDHNYFGPRARGRGNGWETIRNGYSHQQNRPAHNVFEHNLFYGCDGENEIISSKSSYNIYRYNTFRDCAGELTLRHGKHNQVYSNFFLGGGKRGSAGIRIIGAGHRVMHNYIESTRGIGIQIYEGQEQTQATGYQAANDVLVAFNTIVNNGHNGINVKDTERSPRNMIIANNLVVGNARAISPLTPEQLAQSYRLLGNIAFANEIGIPVPDQAFRNADPKLLRAAGGILRPAQGSAVRGAAVNDPSVLGLALDTDIDGQARTQVWDVGADQIDGLGEGTNRPLDRSDLGRGIGPSWMKAR